MRFVIISKTFQLLREKNDNVPSNRLQLEQIISFYLFLFYFAPPSFFLSSKKTNRNSDLKLVAKHRPHDFLDFESASNLNHSHPQIVKFHESSRHPASSGLDEILVSYSRFVVSSAWLESACLSFFVS